MSSYTESQRDSLGEAISKGLLRVRYKDKEVHYQSLREMRELYDLMCRQLDGLSGGQIQTQAVSYYRFGADC